MLALSVHTEEPVTLTDDRYRLQVARDEAGRMVLTMPAMGPTDEMIIQLGGRCYRLTGNRRHAMNGLSMSFDVAKDCQVTRKAAAL